MIEKAGQVIIREINQTVAELHDCVTPVFSVNDKHEAQLEGSAVLTLLKLDEGTRAHPRVFASPCEKGLRKGCGRRRSLPNRPWDRRPKACQRPQAGRNRNRRARFRLARHLPHQIRPRPRPRPHQPLIPLVTQARSDTRADQPHQPLVRRVQPALSHDVLGDAVRRERTCGLT